MLGNDRMETAITEVTLIRRRSDIEKFTWRTHRYFVTFESQIHVEMSTSNQCHNFHVDSPFKIDVISTNFPPGILTWDRRQINEDVFIVLAMQTTLQALTKVDTFSKDTKMFFSFAKTFHAVQSHYVTQIQIHHYYSCRQLLPNQGHQRNIHCNTAFFLIHFP